MKKDFPPGNINVFFLLFMACNFLNKCLLISQELQLLMKPLEFKCWLAFPLEAQTSGRSQLPFRSTCNVQKYDLVCGA